MKGLTGFGAVAALVLTVVGGILPVTGEPILGDAMLVLNQELRIPVGQHVSAILFADAGRAFDSVGDLSDFDLFFSAGPGIGVETPVGPIRLYLGVALNPGDGEPSTRLHFTFGPTF